ncbi:divergent protein kinase domain 2A-like [Odontomachus brunneus]|uniref:divergent protein kinase domain 2A-like n=1 Tax=Odontomachus brunneus TaxID=486640 RepID=UPI0013F1F094|nr:divergent protein kinase domain 2A-like [Odontomachus brunneus]XP_032689448.1 divergent protein kinase domain 2A-like [Odontomachus brunneus]
MILHYAYNIFKFKKWKLLLFIGISCTLLLMKNVVTQYLYPSVTQLAEIHKCPACYGASVCHNVHKINISWRISTILFYLYGTESVFFGAYNQNKVVLKKLAPPSELEAFDIVYCKKFYLEYPCSNVSKKKLNRHIADFNDLIKKIITSDFSEDDSSRLRLCPTTRHIDDLFHNIYLNYKHTNPIEYLINLWTLVSINPEPLILQILPAENGWPVPKYFGACGRIIIAEHVGLTLADYFDKPWIQRARIASSLLNAAYMFTFKNENFSFYLTDVTADNIAVDHNDEAKFIDLEHIIIVDKNISPKKKSEEWHALQENRMHLDCPNCSAFSPKEICNHYLSDHNYYVICQLLLGLGNENSFPGFLHDIPVDIQWQSANIEYLLQQCALPTSNDSRIIFGQQLKASLDTLLKK